MLIRGDLEISATCTVTYVDPKQLLACGHPITQFGPVSMPMTKAEVVATLPSTYNAFKIINTTETIGSFTEDRETAIQGQFGKAARMIPLTMHVTQDGAQEKPRTLHLEVIDQEQLTPSAVMVSVFQSLAQRNGYAVETTYRVRGTVKLAGYPEVKFENLIAPTDLAPANLMAALVLGEQFNRLYANAARRTPIESVDVDVDAIPGRRTVQIESAQAGCDDGSCRGHDFRRDYRPSVARGEQEHPHSGDTAGDTSGWSGAAAGERWQHARSTDAAPSIRRIDAGRERHHYATE